MTAIFRKEMKTYFSSWIGYIFLFFFVLLTGYLFVNVNVFTGIPEYAYTLSNTLIIFLILIPIVTMRLFSEEMKNKTDQLLLTSPVTAGEIVIGKFLAAMGLILTGLLITLIFPAMIAAKGVLPAAGTIGAFAGYIMLISCFVSVGIFISSLTENQIIAAAATFALLFLFFTMDGMAQNVPSTGLAALIMPAAVIIIALFYVNSITKNLTLTVVLGIILAALTAGLFYAKPALFENLNYKILMAFALTSKFNNFASGIFNLGDFIYYISVTAAFLYLTVNTIESKRWK